MARPKVMFVDDDEDIQHMLAAAARNQDFDVISAYDGEEALQKIRRERPNLILLDIMIPKMDGRDLCHAIKGDPEFKGIRIIIFSARDQQYDRQAGLTMGADDYVAKPFHVDSLIRKINYYLRKK